jgi:FixJ family two-component response regulator
LIAILEAEMPKTPVISVVDDDNSAREGTVDLIKAMGFVAEAFPCAKDFLNSKRLHSTSCLIADVRMPGMTGFELHNHLVGSGKIIPTILITAFPNDKDQARAQRTGVFRYLSKPFNEDDLLECIRSALEHRQASGGES